MPIEILMPALSPTMTEGTLARWTVKEGDTIKAGTVIAEIETDKATMEVEAVDEGVMGKILTAEGTDGVPVNQVIALLLAKGEDKKAIDAWKPKEAPKAEAAAAAPAAGGEGKVTAAPAAGGAAGAVIGYQPTKSPELPAGADAQDNSQRSKASPLAKKKAEELGVDLSRVVGSGPHGRITREDVEDAAKRGGSSGLVKRASVPFSKNTNNNMRKTIAKRLSEAKQTMPHFYLSVDVELDKLLDIRVQLNDAAQLAAGKGKEPAYKISVNDMMIKAVALALRDKPEANVSWYDDAIVQYTNVDVSVAVSTDGGLITPIVKNADQKSLPYISNEMKDLAKRARANKLQPEEYQGGGFSVSNLGMYGVKTFSAIINPPQSCILAIGAGEQRAVVKNGQITVANVVTLTLSVDHRSVDGALGAEYLQILKRYIESPALLLV
jgi:pyruvate dehydrogenase E2 component (dihydrolipoamide acetyltransferase)